MEQKLLIGLAKKNKIKKQVISLWYITKVLAKEFCPN